jgi:hypothetical protein
VVSTARGEMIVFRLETVRILVAMIVTTGAAAAAAVAAVVVVWVDTPHIGRRAIDLANDRSILRNIQLFWIKRLCEHCWMFGQTINRI